MILYKFYLKNVKSSIKFNLKVIIKSHNIKILVIICYKGIIVYKIITKIISRHSKKIKKLE